MFKCNIGPRCSDVSLDGSEVDLFASFCAADCSWTWSPASDKPGTTSALSNGSQRACLGATDRMGTIEALHRQSRSVLAVPVKASVSVQSSHSELEWKMASVAYF